MDVVVTYLRGLVPGRRALFALAIGAVCGWLAALAGMPLPWMLGPMIGNTLAAVLALPVRGPDRLRPLVIPVIGVMLGSAMSPEMFGAAGRYAASFALLLPFLGLTALVSYAVYRRLGRYDPVTAFFSAMPGGLNDMLILGGAAGGNEKRIALAHAARVLLVILFVVLFYGYALDVTSDEVSRGTAATALAPLDWLLLGAAAVAGVPLGKLMRMPAPQIVGPMLLSGAMHVTGLVTVAPPGFLIVVAQVVIGTVIGCRFLGTTARQIGRDLSLGAVSSLAMIAVAVGFATALTALTGIPLSLSFLGYSPGGLTEMSLLALAMGQDVAYVSVLHLVRIMLVIFAAQPVFRLTRPRSGRPAQSGAKPPRSGS
ncbi:AbrB family transcriptional regulator [Limimaricola pyoseonensis]|uniref:Ammonia monooxygenase n=1 Tax=Limimaricola pyoseonensis TaxID=521013 RepID=A0A1G7EBK6_9RHOB|nr:AbrB family transcriptional regulator [Limimaricola pyoseonensis]SDE61027.1 hypothetical protein SAMN04488567_2092 [Limimaricola pyoseonensis]